TQVDFGKNDRLKLYTDFNGEYFTMNFQGSSAPGSFALTEAASFGACFGALVSIIDKPVPINWGSFRVLNVISPVGTFLSAKYPQPLFVGNTQGVSLIAFAA